MQIIINLYLPSLFLALNVQTTFRFFPPKYFFALQPYLLISLLFLAMTFATLTNHLCSACKGRDSGKGKVLQTAYAYMSNMEK